MWGEGVIEGWSHPSPVCCGSQHLATSDSTKPVPMTIRSYSVFSRRSAVIAMWLRKCAMVPFVQVASCRFQIVTVHSQLYSLIAAELRCLRITGRGCNALS